MQALAGLPAGVALAQPAAFPAGNAALPRPPGVPPQSRMVQSTDRLALIRARGELLVCIWPDYFGISRRNARSGEMEGLDVDMAAALAARLSVRVRYVDTTYPDFMDRLDEGDCDIAMTGVGITPARAARIAFSKPYMASPAFAVTTQENPRISSWADLDRVGHVIAVGAGTVQESQMRSLLKNAEILVVQPPGSREAEVLSGRADAFVTDYAYTRGMLATHGWARVLEPPGRWGDTLYAYAVARQERAWLDEVNSFLAAAKADGLLARLAARYGLVPILTY